MSDRKRLRIRSGGPLKGRILLPGDKSLSHRSLLIASLADGVSRIENCLMAGVTETMIECLLALGVDVNITKEPGYPALLIQGRTLRGLIPPSGPLNCRGSATTMRLLAGALAGQVFHSTLDGNRRLRMRPMDRIVEPLKAKGADIRTLNGNAPLMFSPSRLRSSEHVLPLASAQVKSALLLAGLFSDGPTTVIEPHPSRDHLERLLRGLGVPLEDREDKQGRHVVTLLADGASLPPLNLRLPSDPSSAAFLAVAGLLVTDSEIEMPNLCLNPGRTGLFEALDSMAADISISEGPDSNGEPTGSITVRSAVLRGAAIGGRLVTRMIDEFPIFAVAATQAEGMTTVRDATELRFKESDRIQALAEELGKMGAVIQTRSDGFEIHGPVRLQGAVVNGRGDHRLAMSLAVAGLVANGETVVEECHVIRESFPGFPEVLRRLGADVEW
ncbi:MAG TPA: 3-phosphoshikimate 1-carboxyvinyltransferase [Desulfomonilaceae bacterium]|nr:3-phosphoshikimate 1-carboxyvinyltransferase [Desulfomonilaceae bacterium]